MPRRICGVCACGKPLTNRLSNGEYSCNAEFKCLSYSSLKERNDKHYFDMHHLLDTAENYINGEEEGEALSDLVKQYRSEYINWNQGNKLP